MKGLLAALAKDSAPEGKFDGPSEMPSPDDSGAPPDDSDNSAFNDSATQAMDSLKNNDAAGFAEALKACIEMSA
jgi:hypothetical protein